MQSIIITAGTDSAWTVGTYRLPPNSHRLTKSNRTPSSGWWFPSSSMSTIWFGGFCYASKGQCMKKDPNADLGRGKTAGFSVRLYLQKHKINAQVQKTWDEHLNVSQKQSWVVDRGRWKRGREMLVECWVRWWGGHSFWVIMYKSLVCFVKLPHNASKKGELFCVWSEYWE